MDTARACGMVTDAFAAPPAVPRGPAAPATARCAQRERGATVPRGARAFAAHRCGARSSIGIPFAVAVPAQAGRSRVVEADAGTREALPPQRNFVGTGGVLRNPADAFAGAPVVIGHDFCGGGR
jgi:hypothetical protein